MWFRVIQNIIPYKKNNPNFLLAFLVKNSLRIVISYQVFDYTEGEVKLSSK